MTHSFRKIMRNAAVNTVLLALGTAVAATLPMSVLAAPSDAAAVPDSAAATVPYTIARSHEFTLSAADGHDYRIMVAWPDGVPPAAGWPVLYVLDGADNFAITAQTSRRLARAGARSGVRDHVIVAIESGSLPRRIWDYTPPAGDWTIPVGVPAAGHPIGGGDKFLDFLSQKLMPLVSQRWSVDPQRQRLLGHSFGGLIGLHAALSRPETFEAVAAISPSFWYGDGLLHRESSALKTSSRARLFIAAGDKEGSPGASIDPSKNLPTDFAQQSGSQYHILLGQTHGSTMLAGLTSALKFLSEGEKP